MYWLFPKFSQPMSSRKVTSHALNKADFFQNKMTLVVLN